MNRNTELHFSQQPGVEIKRSTFDMSFDHKTTFNTGELVPILVQEILPGDTFKIETNFICRMQTPIKPVMDDAYIDIYYFFVPNRLTWDHWQEFMGENKEGAWDDEQTEYTIPTITNESKWGDELYGFEKGSVADHMGLPVNSTTDPVNALPFRAYVLIYNEWFRNQNLQAPLPTYHQNDGNTTVNINTKNDPAFGGKLLKVNKFHDYFTSALPKPQKGDPVTIGMTGEAPVITSSTENKTLPSYGMKMINTNNHNELLDGFLAVGNIADDGKGVYAVSKEVKNNQQEDTLPVFDGTNNPAAPSNLVADLSQATAIAIEQLRQAIQIQKFLERDARSGTRYIEIIKGHFGVTSPDARMQRPEYLGGERFPINISQVLQTSASQTDSPQGNTAAFSLTGGQKCAGFTKSFTEHGFVIGLACVRTNHSYQQGTNRMWTRQRKFDYYWREFANLGEQEIKLNEIYAYKNMYNQGTFGYQERYAEYRYNQNIITGEMRSTYAQSLDIWHYGDMYEEVPYLSSEWCEETPNNMDRTLAVQSTVSDQFLSEFYFKITATRPMPLYGVPGMMDHF